MRKITFLSIFYLLTLLAISPLHAQKANLKTVVEQKYLLNDVGGLKLASQIEKHYNKFNNMIKQEIFYPTGMPASGNLKMDKKILYSFDNRGRQLGTMEYNGDNILENETKIYWDDKDNRSKIEEIQYTNGTEANTVTTYLLEYDQLGNKKKEFYYTNQGVQEQMKEWFYNKDEEVIKTIQIIEKKNQPLKEHIVKYQRDKKGDLTKATSVENINGKEYRKDLQFFSNNQVVRWRKYISGKFESEFVNEYRDTVVIRSTRRNTKKAISQNTINKGNKRNSEIWVTNSEYDALGNLVISTQSINNKVVFITQYEYDNYGNCERILKTNKESNSKEEELFEYDERGNIAKRTLLKDGQILAQEVFTYEYYPRD